MEESARHCIFQCGSLLSALPGMDVREVALTPAIARLPASRSAVNGVCYLRNEFLPVFSPLALLSGEEHPASCASRILVLNNPGGPWALRVDEVHSLETLEISINTDCQANDAWSNAIVGSATWRGQLVRVIDPNALYRLAVQATSTVECESSDAICGARS